MNFYRTNNQRKFIATDFKMSVVITKSESGSSISAFMIPYYSNDDEMYEPSSPIEFFNEYDKITAFINAIAESKRNSLGLVKES
jgi:hypothetical protein